MNVVLAATFRDSASYLDRYLSQAFALQRLFEQRGDRLRFLWGENDSEDDTPKLLREVDGPVTVVDVSTGAPYYRSTEDHALRWANVAAYSNATLDHVLPDDDVVLWVECDLTWEPDTLAAIADLAAERGSGAAPVWHRRGFFYDTWTTQLNGQPFTPSHPAWSGIVHVDSTAGAVAVDGEKARSCRFSPEDAIKGWWREIGGVWLNTDLRVMQP